MRGGAAGRDRVFGGISLWVGRVSWLDVGDGFGGWDEARGEGKEVGGKMRVPNSFDVVDEVRMGTRPGRSERWRRWVQNIFAAGVVMVVLRSRECGARV